MQIPKELKIGGHTYQVNEVDLEEIEQDLGECNPARNEIRIRRDIPQTQKEETLIHEVMHAINLSLKEEVINGLAHSVYQVLKDNDLLK